MISRKTAQKGASCRVSKLGVFCFLFLFCGFSESKLLSSLTLPGAKARTSDASTALAQAAQVATDVPNSMAEYVNMSDSCNKTTCSFEKNCLSSCQMTCAKRLGVQTYVHAFPANGT